ncbi:MAG: hypothetical protein NT109_11035 [Flavobacteriia bacterium]|nr:hypothetical protein [Flavobacteriia bacterium]
MKLKNLPLFVCISLTSCLVGQRTKDTIKELKKDDKWVNEIIKLDKEISSKSDSIKLLKINLSTLKDSIAKIANNPNDSSKEKEKFSKIGAQFWLNTNLEATTLNDGEKLFFAQAKETWDSCFIHKIPAYCYHDKDTLKEFGVLYNLHALNSGKLAPAGSKIPTMQEVEELIKSFGPMDLSASLLLKSKDPKLWGKPGVGLFDMNVKPVGFRLIDGNDWYFGDKVYFYCESLTKNDLSFYVFSDFSDKIYFLNRNITSDNVNYGMYVRCIKSK